MAEKSVLWGLFLFVNKYGESLENKENKRNARKANCKYHEIEIPEELKDMVADVEEKLVAKKESEEMLIDDVMEKPSEEMQGNPEDEMPENL